MAKQKGITPMTGSMGMLSYYYHSIDGYLVRQKGGISKERIYKDPKLVRIKENATEFGSASTATRVIRNGFMQLIKPVADPRMTGRLNKANGECIKMDVESARGKRNMVKGVLSHLEGFEFNLHAHLASVLLVEPSVYFDRAGGTAIVQLYAFTPKLVVRAPHGATHFRLTTGISELDFVAKRATGQQSTVSKLIAMSATSSGTITMVNEFRANTVLPVMVVMGIEFFQMVNNQVMPLKNQAGNALAVARVSLA